MGVHAVYYIDTGTLLPAFSQSHTTPVLTNTGQVDTSASPSGDAMIVQYGFPSALQPLTLDNQDPSSITMPEGWIWQ
jgi:hypothetical protein